jgi:hypothetical protein
VVEIAGDYIYVQGEMKERKGEEWSSKGMDECLLTGWQTVYTSSGQCPSQAPPTPDYSLVYTTHT